MSLINNMLKDLEKRKNLQRNIPPIALVSLPRPERKFPVNKIIFCVIGLILALAILFQLIRNTQYMLAPMLDNPKEMENLPTLSESEWLKPVTIKGITLQVKDNITELTFLLDHPVLYRLDSNEMNNRLSLTIEGSKLESALPPTSYLSTGIQHFNVSQHKSDTQFDFALAPDAIVKYINLNTENKNPEIVIAIENPHPKQNELVSLSNAPVKTQAIQSLLAQRYQAALTNAENGRYQNAIQQLAQLLEVDPDHKDARVSLAALLIDQGQVSTAKQVIGAGLKLNQTYLPFIELKARILTLEGNIQGALSLLQSLSPPLADNPDYHAFIAALYERSNNNTLAVSIYQKLLTFNSHNGNWWFGLAVSLDKLGQQRSASNAYTRALTEGHLPAESIAYVQTRLKALQEGVHEKG